MLPRSTRITSHQLSGPPCVGKDGNVHLEQRRVCVTQSSDRQVNTGCLSESLVDILGSVTTRSPGSWKAARMWLVKVPGVKRPATGGLRGSSKLHSSLGSVPGRYDTDISRVFNDNNGMSCQQKLLPGSLQIYDADAITCPLNYVGVQNNAVWASLRVAQNIFFKILFIYLFLERGEGRARGRETLM